MTPTEISPEQESLRAYVKRRWPGFDQGRVELARCPLCGALDLICAHTVGSFNIVVTEQPNNNGCRPCQYIATRHPELGEWIAAVVEHQIRRALAEQGGAAP